MSYEYIAQQIIDTDYILIITGGGFSQAAGLDYYDMEYFRDVYPQLWKVGFRTLNNILNYKEKYCPDNQTLWCDEMKWGYIATHGMVVNYNYSNKSVVYQYLKKIVELKPKDALFLTTTNIDNLHDINGFDPQQVYKIYGDYTYLQCSIPCRRDAIFEAKEYYQYILENLDKNTLKCATNAIPKCPWCNEQMMVNIRGAGSTFIDDIYQQRTHYMSFLRKAMNSRFVILELGLNSVNKMIACQFKYPIEQILLTNELALLIRVNIDMECETDNQILLNKPNQYISVIDSKYGNIRNVIDGIYMQYLCKVYDQHIK